MKLSFPKMLLGLVLLIAVGGGLYAINVNGQETRTAGSGATLDGTGAAWDVRCQEIPDSGDKHCEAFQKLVVQKSGQRLIEVAIAKDAATKASKAVFILPLGILLEPGVRLMVDDQDLMFFNPQFCTAEGCVASVPVDKTILKTMKKGSKATIAMQNMQGRPIQIELSLSGVSKSLKEVGL